MIRPINIKLNAAHPELPLVEATTFTGAPSSVFIRGVPKNCGNWSITAVNVAVTYPDNATTTRAAVESAEGVWVATIPGTATSGRTVAGFRILADGIDENGAAVTGYVLGFADFAVLSFFPVPAPGETFFYLRYFDTMPTAAKKMDVTTIDGILKYNNGTAWLPFTDLSNYYTKAETDNAIERVIAYDNTVTRTSANGVKSSGIWAAIWGALASLPMGFTSLYDWVVDQLAKKLSLSGGTIMGPLEINDNFPLTLRPPPDPGDTRTPCLYLVRDPGNGKWEFMIGYDTSRPDYDIYLPNANGTLALTSAIPYNLTTKTISNNAVTLDDRAMNAVAVDSAIASLTINFPTATTGKVRDFGLRLSVASGITTAPELALPQGVTCENADGEAPEIGADGAATILYFTETAANVFLVKGEVVTAIS